MNNSYKHSRKQSGIALITVLWILALLMIMTGSYSIFTRTDTQLTAHYVHAARARALAQGGIWLGMAELLKPATEQIWTHDGTSYPVQFGEGSLHISLQDESGKIDLNTARQELLLALLQSTGLEEEESQQTLDVILDWRDRDNLVHPQGAEDPDYQSAGFEYGAKDGPFNTVEELRQVMGVSEPLYQALYPALTVHSHIPSINPQFAPAYVLRSLPGIELADIDQLLESRKQEPQTMLAIPSVDRRYLTNIKGKIFTITSLANLNDTNMTIQAVVLLKNNDNPPFSMLSWREATPAGINNKTE